MPTRRNSISTFAHMPTGEWPIDNGVVIQKGWNGPNITACILLIISIDIINASLPAAVFYANLCARSASRVAAFEQHCEIRNYIVEYRCIECSVDHVWSKCHRWIPNLLICPLGLIRFLHHSHKSIFCWYAKVAEEPTGCLEFFDSKQFWFALLAEYNFTHAWFMEDKIVE